MRTMTLNQHIAYFDGYFVNLPQRHSWIAKEAEDKPNWWTRNVAPMLPTAETFGPHLSPEAAYNMMMQNPDSRAAWEKARQTAGLQQNPDQFMQWITNTMNRDFLLGVSANETGRKLAAAGVGGGLGAGIGALFGGGKGAMIGGLLGTLVGFVAQWTGLVPEDVWNKLTNARIKGTLPDVIEQVKQKAIKQGATPEDLAKIPEKPELAAAIVRAETETKKEKAQADMVAAKASGNMQQYADAQTRFNTADTDLKKMQVTAQTQRTIETTPTGAQAPSAAQLEMNKRSLQAAQAEVDRTQAAAKTALPGEQAKAQQAAANALANFSRVKQTVTAGKMPESGMLPSDERPGFMSTWGTDIKKHTWDALKGSPKTGPSDVLPATPAPAPAAPPATPPAAPPAAAPPAANTSAVVQDPNKFLKMPASGEFAKRPWYAELLKDAAGPAAPQAGMNVMPTPTAPPQAQTPPPVPLVTPQGMPQPTKPPPPLQLPPVSIVPPATEKPSPGFLPPPEAGMNVMPTPTPPPEIPQVPMPKQQPTVMAKAGALMQMPWWEVQKTAILQSPAPGAATFGSRLEQGPPTEPATNAPDVVKATPIEGTGPELSKSPVINATQMAPLAKTAADLLQTPWWKLQKTAIVTTPQGAPDAGVPDIQTAPPASGASAPPVGEAGMGAPTQQPQQAQAQMQPQKPPTPLPNEGDHFGLKRDKIRGQIQIQKTKADAEKAERVAKAKVMEAQAQVMVSQAQAGQAQATAANDAQKRNQQMAQQQQDATAAAQQVNQPKPGSMPTPQSPSPMPV